jgi:hypothetical protein
LKNDAMKNCIWEILNLKRTSEKRFLIIQLSYHVGEESEL